MAADLEKSTVSSATSRGTFSARRDREKPIRLGLEIDVAPVERDALLGEHDGGPVHERADRVADELELHGFSPFAK